LTSHVSCLIYTGGRTYGVAKDVELFAVKVFGADGSSRFSDIVAALEYVIDKKEKSTNIHMVVNLSLGTERVARALNRAVDNAVKAGITVVVAAGNGGVNACTYSPASADLAVTVAASTIDK
jgi:subtilisin family serine protease